MTSSKEHMKKTNLYMNQLVEKNPDVVDTLASRAAKNRDKFDERILF